MYKHTNNWFLTSQLRQWLLERPPVETPLSVLEIGSYEGMSSTCLLDRLCNHRDSKMFCVDPFTLDDTKLNFIHNVNLSKNKDRLCLREEESDNFFRKNTKMFDFIYIDGDHSLPQVKKDIENSWNVLSQGGTLWIDDYLGDHGRIKPVVDETIKKFQYNIEFSGYQLHLTKL